MTMMAAPPEGMGLTLEETSKLLGHHSPEFTARRYLSLRTGWLHRAQHAAAAFGAPAETVQTLFPEL